MKKLIAKGPGGSYIVIGLDPTKQAKVLAESTMGKWPDLATVEEVSRAITQGSTDLEAFMQVFEAANFETELCEE